MHAIVFSIGGQAVTIRSGDPGLLEIFADYFSYYRPEIPGRAEPSGLSLEISMVDERPGLNDFNARGSLVAKTGVIEMWSGGGRCWFDMEVAWFVAEPSAGVIRGWVSPPALRQPRILTNTYALFPLLLALRSRGVYHLHAAAAVSPGGELWLLCGPQRAGKTTLATALGLCGWKPVSDDSMLLSSGSGGGPGLQALMKDFHLSDEMFERWEGLRAAARQRHFQGRSGFGGLEFFGAAGEARRVFSRVDRVVLPEVVPVESSSLAAIAASEALEALAGQSIYFQLLPGHTERQMELLAALVRGAACFRMKSGQDILDNPLRAAELLLSAA